MFIIFMSGRTLKLYSKSGSKHNIHFNLGRKGAYITIFTVVSTGDSSNINKKTILVRIYTAVL